MSDTVIQVEVLSKQYRYGVIGHGTLYKDLQSWWARVRGKEDPNTIIDDHAGPGFEGERFWALKDLSFEVNRGEVLGIIGRNGAGKSTLLKILSRVTAPTRGVARVRGRIASLLEVGTGMHPELTGRENIYLNGAILGMNRAEIETKFDEIVAFSEVEKFIDTPFKRYSSGMRVRLAFAVAAHLEPEILLVDEVLAVGDAEFQNKCLGKMKDVTGQGRTVLFVSHNMQAVKNLCERGMLIEGGTIAAIGTADDVVETYLSSGYRPETGKDITPDMHKTYPPPLEVFRVEILNRNGELTGTILRDETFSIRLYYKIHDPGRKYRFSVSFNTTNRLRIASIDSSHDGSIFFSGEKKQIYTIEASMKNIFLPGKYFTNVHVSSSHVKGLDLIENIPITVKPVSVNAANYHIGGIVDFEANWMEPVSNDLRESNKG